MATLLGLSHLLWPIRRSIVHQVEYNVCRPMAHPYSTRSNSNFGGADLGDENERRKVLKRPCVELCWMRYSDIPYLVVIRYVNVRRIE